MLVAKTDKGYIKGDLHAGVEFVTKDQARQFTEVEVRLYRDSIASDVFEFYGCNELKFEII